MSLARARKAVEGWLGEDHEGLVMTLVEDPSFVEYIKAVSQAFGALAELLVPLDVAYQHTRMVVEQDYTPDERQRVGAIALAAINEVRSELFRFASSPSSLKEKK